MQQTEGKDPGAQALVEIFVDAARRLMPPLQQKQRPEAALPLTHLTRVGEHMTSTLPDADRAPDDCAAHMFAYGALMAMVAVVTGRLDPHRFLALAGLHPNAPRMTGPSAGAAPPPHQPFFGGLGAPAGLGAFRPGASPRPANLGPLLRILRTGQAPPPPKPLGTL